MNVVGNCQVSLGFKILDGLKVTYVASIEAMWASWRSRESDRRRREEPLQKNEWLRHKMVSCMEYEKGEKPRDSIQRLLSRDRCLTPSYSYMYTVKYYSAGELIARSSLQR